MNTSTVSQPDMTASNFLSAECSAGPTQTPAISNLGVLLRFVIAFIGGLAVYGPALLIPKIPAMDVNADALAGNWGLVMIKQSATLFTIPLVALLLICVYTRFIDRRPFKVTGIRVDRRTIPTLLIGTAISLVVIVPASVLFGKLELVEVIAFTSPEPLWVGILNTLLLGFVMQGATEEFIWRGWLSQSVGGSWKRQALITSVAFGLIHIISNGGHDSIWEGALYLTAAGAFGFTAAALYFATGSIWAAVGIHGGLHLANYIATFFGGGEGPAMEALQIVLYVAIGWAVMHQFLKRPENQSIG
ncbi:MAG: CPBP family intramembrane metalloprotease [Ancrocorticia sp.]